MVYLFMIEVAFLLRMGFLVLELITNASGFPLDFWKFLLLPIDVDLRLLSSKILWFSVQLKSNSFPFSHIASLSVPTIRAYTFELSKAS